MAFAEGCAVPCILGKGCSVADEGLEERQDLVVSYLFETALHSDMHVRALLHRGSKLGACLWWIIMLEPI